MNRIVVVFALSSLLVILQCHEKPASLSLNISLNGTLKTSEGNLPAEDLGPHQFSSYRDRKMLTLKSKEVIRYDSDGWYTSKGTLQFWMKLESLSTSQPSVITSLTDGKDFFLQGVSQEKTIRLYFLDSSGRLYAQSSPKVFRPGTWMHLVIVWNRNLKEPISLFINGYFTRMAPLRDGYRPDTKDRAGFYLGNTGNSQEFSVSLREVSLQSSTRTEKQIMSSFNAGIKEMRTPIIWSASTLRHFAGKSVVAAGASSGEAWTADTLFAFQNRIKLPENSDYRFSFRVKPMSGLSKNVLRCEVWKSEPSQHFPLATWENRTGDLTEIGKYKTITLNFRAEAGTTIGYAFFSFIPSKYSLFLDTIELQTTNGRWKDQRRAEDLEHTVGVWIKDPEAAKGRAWTNANTLLYGPYTCIGQPGRYRASWRMSIASWLPENEPLVVLDVYAHDGLMHGGRRGTRSYGKLAVGSSDFLHQNAWENKSIEFRYDGANLLEFRTHARLMKPGAVFIDSVEVEWIGSK